MAFIYDLTDTWNNAVTSFNGIKLNATDTASAAGSKLLDLQINGASKFTVGKTGTVTATGIIQSTTGGFTFPDGTTQITRAVTNVTATDGSIAITGTTDVNLSVVSSPKAYAVTTVVRNNNGATLTKGTAVYINGAIGQNPTVTKAIASGDSTSAQTLGLIAEDIANNANGNVILIGTLYNINTSAYADGQQLYLSPTTAGTLTTTKPYAPGHLVYMAVVEHSHPSQGKLFVKVQNGYELEELHNVSAQNPANNDGIFYNTLTSLWEKKSIVTALGYTPYNATNPAGYTTNVGTVTSVAGTGTVSGLTLTGSITTSGSLTLGGALALTSGNVTTALGYTPYNATNPAGYTANTGTVTSVDLIAGTGVSVSGGPITSSGSITVTNTAPDQVVSLTAGTNVTVTGAYPNFTIAATGGGGSGTVTSVDASGGTTGLTFSGGPITTSGTLTLAGTLALANGGTGATDAATALTNIGAYAATNPSGYITSSALSGYLTSAVAATTYQPLDGDLTSIAGLAGTTGLIRKIAADTYTLDTATYLTGITYGQVTTALGYTPYDAANPTAYITSSALSPYLTSATAATTYQPLDGDLTAIAAIAGSTGIVRKTAADTYTLDTNTYLTGITSGQVTTALGFTPYDAANPSGYISSSALTPYLTSATAATTYQPLDGDLTAIAALSGTAGIVRKTAADTYTLDTSTYLTGITSGQVTTALGYTPYDSTNPSSYLSTVSLTSNVTGTLPITNGGTGATTAGAARTSLSAAALGANTDITSIALTSGTITAVPSGGTDIVNKLYADSIATGINFHQSVRLATAAALPTNTYNNGSSGVNATLTATANGALSIDGVTAVVGNRILVKNEAISANNGIYTVTQVGDGSTPYILTRATDFDSSGSGVDQIDAGDFFIVTAGTTQSNTSWVQQTPLPITVGTTGLVFTQFAAPVTYSAGTGLSLAGTVFSLTNTGLTASTYGSASSVPVIAFNAQGQATGVTNTSIAISGSQITSGTVAVANGGTGASDAATALTNLGAYPAANPSGYTSNVGTVTSVGGTGTVNGITLTGTVTASGSLTLGGTLSGVDLTSQVTGTLPAANGGTGLTSPGTSGNVLTSNGSAWVSQLPAAGGIKYTTVKTANYTAAANDGVQTNTSGGAFTVTLPATPAVGDQVIVTDSAGSWATNNLTVGRNGSTIESAAEDLVCNISNVSVQLVYNGTTWDVFAQVGGTSGLADINSQTSGTLTVSRGGTGATTLTGYVKGSGTSAMTASAAIPVADVTGAAPLASPTFTGTVTTATLDALGSVRSNITTVAASAVDCSLGNYFIKTASGALTWTVTNIPASRAYSFLLELTNGGTGTQTWFSGIKWPGGTAPTLTASGVDVLGFITDDGGTTWRGVQLMKDSK